MLFRSFLDRDDLAALYASADVCMLPSQTETCGLVALEAMASGLPVVAADAGGLRESVEHEVSGLLVPPDDAHGFLSAVARLVIDRDARHAFSLAARARAETRDQAPEDEALLEQYAALLPREQVSHAGVTPCAA